MKMKDNTKVIKTIEESVVGANRQSEVLNELKSRGIICEKEISNLLSSHYRREVIKLKQTIKEICSDEGVKWNEEEWKGIDESFMRSCRLKLVPYQYYPADLGIDELQEGIYSLSDRIDGLEELYYHTEPVGKTFPLKLKLDNDGDYVWVDYSFSVRRVYAGSERWKGYMVFYGTAVFPGYNGEVDISIKEDNGTFKSIAYQKVYVRSEDPIWKKKKTNPETRYYLDLLDDYKTEYRGE